ncbi:MAG: flagellar M-ring protein FliF [Myxococcaceae bacterium]|nr:flagellar M-ring protein FliF [Myxococcaceae bacterium]
MEPLQKQLADLPKQLMSGAGKTRWVLLALAVLLVAAGVGISALGAADGYQYAFTNLSSEDGPEVSSVLKSAQIPFRLEAGGSALAVPASKVYDARLVLATAGLPRNGGTGFELFDRGDLGVSEFTQKVNLRRATEGELARTIGRLSGVRSARVHLTLPEKGLFRDEGRSAQAAVVLNLQPGRVLNERELSGVRHLVASAVPSLGPNAVTIVDGRGSVLAAEGSWGEEMGSYQRTLERDLEQRVVGLLEPAVGAGQVVARVTASLDMTEVATTSDVVDPDATAVRSERTVNQNQSQDSATKAGVAGAAANQPLAAAGAATAQPGNRSASSTQEETRNFDVSKTTTKTLAKTPRLTRLSVAILLDGVDGKPRPEAEVAQLAELAKGALGLDTSRGDVLNISSAVFSHSAEGALAPEAAESIPRLYMYGAAGAALLLLIAVVLVVALRKKAPITADAPLLRAGARVSEIEAEEQLAPAPVKKPVVPVTEEAKALPDPALAYRERARELAKADPIKAAHLIRAWIANDVEGREANRG